MTAKQYRSLMLILNGVMEMDGYGKHAISNIYFDTPDFLLVRTSMEKPVYKEKVRLRSYGTDISDNSLAFVEIKKKSESVVYKRRMAMPLETARKYLYYGIEPGEKGQVYQEVDYMIRRYGLKPMVYISYERTAYICQMDGQLRVTFDSNVLGRTGELDLCRGPYGEGLLPPETILMEMKLANAMPLWLSQVLADLGIFPVSYSKYGTFYSRFVHPALVAGNLEMNMAPGIPLVGIKGGVICA